MIQYINHSNKIEILLEINQIKNTLTIRLVTKHTMQKQQLLSQREDL